MDGWSRHHGYLRHDIDEPQLQQRNAYARLKRNCCSGCTGSGNLCASFGAAERCA
jgi:hypothetical protein